MIDAREYLKTFQREEAMLRLKVRQLQNLRDRLTNLSVPMDKEQVSHTPNVSLMSETIALIVDMEKEINLRTDRLTEFKCEAYRYFDQIRPERASLLMDRYFEGKKNGQICEERFITERHLRRLMREAIDSLQGVLNQAQAQQDAKVVR